MTVDAVTWAAKRVADHLTVRDHTVIARRTNPDANPEATGALDNHSLAARIIRDLLANGWTPPHSPREDLNLTARDQQILYRVAHGQTNAQIAAHLHVKEDAIKSALKRIYAKMGANDRAHAVHIAHQTGALGGGDAA